MDSKKYTVEAHSCVYCEAIMDITCWAIATQLLMITKEQGVSTWIRT